MILEVRAVAPFYKNGFVVGCERTREGVLIDPGDEVDQLLAAVFEADVQIQRILLTHAHVDHSGLLPRLVAEGFRGTIWCTGATRDLLAVMLPDAARIHEQDVARRNRRADRADEPAIRPLFTLEDAEAVIDFAHPVELEEAVEVCPGAEARFWNAGHILGSASVELTMAGVRTLFSGDLGPRHKSFQADPTGPAGVDHLICESTYGDRDREDVTIAERRGLLEREVRAALDRGGNLVIPVFALERTQELLLDLAHLIEHGRLGRAPVFIDSPLASRATQVFQRHAAELEDMGGTEVFQHPSFHFTESVAESIRLNDVKGAVILSASGMCEAGRIRHHLVHNLPNRQSTILFVGFQASGTLGHAILSGAKRVRISGRDVAVRAEVRRIDSYSAHADRSELIEWITARQPVTGSLFLAHGEDRAIHSLQQELGRRFASVVAPEIGERYELSAGKPARRLRAGRADIAGVVGGDWQNAYGEFAANLKQELQRIESASQRAEAIARMRSILDDYRHVRQAQARQPA